MCTQMTIAASADMVRCDMAMLILNDVIEATWGTVMSANGYSRPSTVRGSGVGRRVYVCPNFVAHQCIFFLLLNCGWLAGSA